MRGVGVLTVAALAAALCFPAVVRAQQAADMSFFVTSVGKGNGADLGGLEGADAHCQALARAAGSTSSNWRAYLSTTAPGGDAGVNARDRIGNGLRLLLRNESIGQAHARPLPLVPETASIDSVLATMRREHTQMAVVLDEHGGTAGIVTLEDLFEEVVGDIDAGPGSAPVPYRDRDGLLRVPGTMRLDELGRQFDLDLEHEDVDSVSGLVLTLLGRPPQVGDSVRYDRLSLTVTAVKGRGVEECAVALAA